MVTRSTTLICSLPRSGSWLLCAGLEATGLAGHPQEYFRRELRRHYTSRWSIPLRASARRYTAAAVRDATGDNGVASIKVHWQDFAPLVTALREEGGQGTERELVESVVPNPHYVHLVRRDRLRQAISWCRALDTDVWWDGDRHPRQTGTGHGWDPDVEKVEALYDVLARQEADWLGFFERSGIVPVEVVYEDLVDDWEPTLRRILEEIDAGDSSSVAIAPPPLRAQSDSMSERWLAVWRHLRTAMEAPLEPAQPQPVDASVASRPARRLPARRRLTPHPLAEVVANRRWLRRQRPFPHVVADRVFRAEVYAELEAAFATILDRGLDAAGGFGPRAPGYDAHTHGVGPDGPLAVFGSRAWHDLLCEVAGVAGSGHVACSLYHHPVGSAPGVPHNDLNPGWFDGPAPPGMTLHSDPARCSYTTGEAVDPTAHPVCTARGVVMHFFLCNGPWKRGDLGSIGLHADPSDPAEGPAVTVPPIDNSLVAFECTPYSFHSFLGRHRTPRNMVTLWVHRPYDDVASRWGENAIVDWSL